MVGAKAKKREEEEEDINMR